MKLAILFALALVGSAAPAQMGNMMVLMPATPVMALNRKDIRSELKLQKDQGKQIDAIEKDAMQAMNSASRGGNDFSSALTPMTKMAEASEKIVSVLDEAQNKRLLEIRIQMMGSAAILDPQVAKLLGLSAEQQKQASDSEDAYISACMSKMQSNHSSSLRNEIKKLRDAQEGAMLAILTESQRDTFKEMQGKPFKNARLQDGF